TDPVFYVKYKGYDETAQVRVSNIRPLASDFKKRKAEEPLESVSKTSHVPTAPAAPTNSSVISAAANINPELATQVKKAPSKVSDGPPRAPRPSKKINSNKQLEKTKSGWEAFKAKGVGKMGKKDSMFRIKDDPNARVGFTGSGQPMRKDAPRTRHVYNPEDEEN
ncbi:hypothetical protein LTS18_006515, partial [Coniosporium uncinatum]